MMRWLAILFSMLLIGSASAQTAWTSIKDSANVYPTQREAIEAMVDNFSAKLKAQGFLPDDGTIVVGELPTESNSANGSFAGSSSAGGISAESGPRVTSEARDKAIRIAMDRLVKDIHPAKIQGRTPAYTPGKYDVLVSIGIDNCELIERSSVITLKGYQGHIKGVIAHGLLDESFQADFSNQPWVNDWPGFMRSQFSRSWIAGRSGLGSAGETEALNAAALDAADQIIRAAKGRIQPVDESIAQESLRGVIASRIQAGGAIDRFIQRVDQENASVWRAAVLVPSGDESVNALVAPAATLQHARRVSYSVNQSAWASIGIMAVVIVVLYLLLKGITRGYFNWRLRIGAVALLLIAAAFLLLLTLVVGRATVSPQALPSRAEIPRP